MRFERDGKRVEVTIRSGSTTATLELSQLVRAAMVKLGWHPMAMGDTADAMLEGDLCQECAAFIDDEDPAERNNPNCGVPRSCADCRRRHPPKPKRKLRR